MNELTNLNQLVSEIKFFENQAVVSYWEIGKRLTQAKEQVPYGEWGKWVKDNLSYSERTANRLIQIYNENELSSTSTHLTFSKQVELLSLPQEDRKEFVENNDVADMTIRELRKEIKEHKDQNKQIKEELQDKDNYIDTLINDNNLLNTELENKANTEPQVIEKEVIKEVTPDDYEQIKEQIKKLQADNDDLKNKLVIEKNKKQQAIGQLEEEQQKEKIIKEINSFAWTINGFIKDVGGLIYLTDYIDEVPKASRDLFISTAKTLKDWANQLDYNIQKRNED